MNLPWVSILINNYNYDQYVGEAIRSALDQSYPYIEVVVVDDGSTDHSAEIISGFGDQIISVKKSNGGQASAINHAFNFTKGEIIIILDADDLLGSDIVTQVVDIFDGETVKVHWRLQAIYGGGNKINRLIPEGRLASGDLKSQLIAKGPAHCGGPPESPPTSGNAWSRKFLSQVLPINEEIFKGGIDFYLFVMAPLFGRIKSIDRSGGFYRVHGMNNTLDPAYRHKFFQRYEFCCETLSEKMKSMGIEHSAASWPEDHWFHKLEEALKEIQENIPMEASVILIDDGNWVEGNWVAGRKRRYLVEKDGIDWGVPVSSEQAIQAVDEIKKDMGVYLVIAWCSFWWWEYLPGFYEYINREGEAVIKNERLEIYRL